MSLTEPITLKFLYAKEDHKLEVHMEFEWIPDKRLQSTLPRLPNADPK